MASYSANSIQQQLDELLAKYSSKTQVAIAVQSLDNNQIIYQKNANKHLVPASSLKLITAFSALKVLGPNFHFKTQLRTDDQQYPKGAQHLKGNLYVDFNGDPDLSLKNLDQLIGNLKQKGIKSIEGHVLIEDELYDDQGFARGVENSDKAYCYGAPVYAVNLARNCLPVTVVASQKIGGKPRLIFPRGIEMNIINQVRTRGRKGKSCGLSLHLNRKQQYVLQGCIRQGQRRQFSLPLIDASNFAQKLVMSLLKKHDIKVENHELTTQQLSKIHKVISEHQSRSLKQMLMIMLKKSDNFIANALFRKVGVNHYTQQSDGSWALSAKAVTDLMRQAKVPVQTQMALYEGAGLSRDNRVSALEFMKLLQYIWQQPQLSQHFIPALPISGVKGSTLARRMTEKNMRGRVKAKTGWMRGITALSGYITTQSGRPLAFSITVNDSRKRNHKALIDKICRLLAQLK